MCYALRLWAGWKLQYCSAFLISPDFDSSNFSAELSVRRILPLPIATQREGGGGVGDCLSTPALFCSPVSRTEPHNPGSLCEERSSSPPPPLPLPGKLVPRFPADGSTNFTILNLFSSITHTRPFIYADTLMLFGFLFYIWSECFPVEILDTKTTLWRQSKDDLSQRTVRRSIHASSSKTLNLR